jgi:DNA-binding NarL/FixJ family response regulator
MNSQDNLTKQERRILELVANGARNSKIATELFISTKTVQTHLHHIFSKLGVSSRTEAALHIWSAATLPSPKIHEIMEDSAVREG